MTDAHIENNDLEQLLKQHFAEARLDAPADAAFVEGVLRRIRRRERWDRAIAVALSFAILAIAAATTPLLELSTSVSTLPIVVAERLGQGGSPTAFVLSALLVVFVVDQITGVVFNR